MQNTLDYCVDKKCVRTKSRGYKYQLVDLEMYYDMTKVTSGNTCIRILSIY